MATYLVGDIQGCFNCLYELLDQVSFSHRDHLWAAGDLVNRGPQSLETLRFCYSLGDRFRTVQGNHDLHLLAVASGHKSAGAKDTLQAILNAPDRHKLLEWLRHQPLLLSSKEVTLVHAGIPPQWNLETAARLAKEVESILHSEQPGRLFSVMYGNQPDLWSEEISGPERLRIITNYFTRMRFCDAQGKLELATKSGPATPPKGYKPWFAHVERLTRNDTIAFGHWAALEGNVKESRLIALDTGCVWGARMRLHCLESGQQYHVNCHKPLQKA